MRISKQELDNIIKEEIETAMDEGFLDRMKSMGSRAGSKVAGAFGADTASREMGAKADTLRDKSAAEKAEKTASRDRRKADKRGKRDRRKADARAKKSGQTYPATELTALAATLRNVAQKSGVPFPGGRGNMVAALEKVLRSGGYALDEARGERVFIGQEGNIEISAKSAPVFVKWLAQVKEKAPDVFTSLSRELGNYRFDLPAELAATAAPDAPGEEEEDIDVDALAGSDEELEASADAIAAAGGEDVAIELDPEAGDTEIDLTDEQPGAAEVTAVNQNNLATRDADNYGDDGKLNDKGLELAKAQIEFLKKNGKNIPDILSKAVKAAGPPEITLSMKDRGEGARSSSIHSIALDMLGLEAPPNPNGSPAEKETNKKFNKLMIDLTKGLAGAVKQLSPNAKVTTVNESKVTAANESKITQRWKILSGIK